MKMNANKRIIIIQMPKKILLKVIKNIVSNNPIIQEAILELIVSIKVVDNKIFLQMLLVEKDIKLKNNP